MSRRSPLRLILFLVLVAALVAYVVVQWADWQEQTLADDLLNPAPVVVVPGDGGTAAGSGGETGMSASGDDESPTLTTDVRGVEDPAYFVDARIDREQARSRRIELLEGLVANPDVNAETRQRAEEELVTLSRRITQEAEIESLVRARGFEDVLVYLYDEAAVVIVNAAELTEAQVAQVADAVNKVASVPVSAISVMARPGS
ncbi:MAG TPA: SpoIIIAH-like family protein [Bacillota bacterium]